MPEEFLILTVIAAVTGLGFYIVRAVSRYAERQLEVERGADDGELRARVEMLEGEVAELREGQGRMAELEERLDFAERMLTRARPPQALEPEP